jgi:DNA-binding beta-propeller fold protein YncE
MMFPRAFRIDAEPGSVQQILPRGQNERFEGLSFSADGKILAAATADTNTVHLFRRRADSKFENVPYASIGGLNYPHDVAFGKFGAKESLAVAERGGAISIYEQRSGGIFGPAASCAISGPDARLSHTDGVAFVPPYNDCVAACNLLTGTVSFYSQTSSDPLCFAIIPGAELSHSSMDDPDGLDFSADGGFLAVANHGDHSISLFKRMGGPVWGKIPTYGPEPVAVIKDPDLRHTHSVVFTDGGHLVATSAGANFFYVYRTLKGWLRRKVAPERVHRQVVADDQVFREVNSLNKMEGGPKGVAVHGRTLAVCSPEIGIKIYSFCG